MQNTNTAIPADGQNIGGATLPLETNKKDEVAVTTSSVNDNPAGKKESNEQKYYSQPHSPVDPEPAADVSNNPILGEAVVIQIPTSDIDLDSIAVDQDFAAMAAVKPDSSAPPIRKPGNQLWFSPHPDQKLWRSFLTIKDESDKDTIFVLDRSLAEALQGEYITTLFVPCITQQEEVFFWPIKLPDSEGRIDKWNTSKLGHAVAEAGKWLRLRSNQFAECYDKVTALKQLPPPMWPDDVLDLLKKAVNKTYVGSLEHPLLKRLLGGD